MSKPLHYPANTLICQQKYIKHFTCLAPFCLTTELNLLLGTVQNQNLHSRGPKCAARLAHSASLTLCNQEEKSRHNSGRSPKTSFHFPTKNCVTKTFQAPPSSVDPQTHVTYYCTAFLRTFTQNIDHQLNLQQNTHVMLKSLPKH